MCTGVLKSGFLGHSRPTELESLQLVLPSQGKSLGLGINQSSLR